jgi:hypothetical protein
MAILNDRTIYPTSAHNHHGEPQWEGSEAQHFLKLDVSEDKHILLQPKGLLESRKEFYENYSLSVIQKHVEQEAGLQKFRARHSSKKWGLCCACK